MVQNLVISLNDKTDRTFHISIFGYISLCLIVAKYFMVCIFLNLSSYLFVNTEVLSSSPIFSYVYK